MVGNRAGLVIGQQIVILLLLLFRQLGVLDAFREKLSQYRNLSGRYQVPILDRLFQLVGIGRVPPLGVEKLVGVVIHAILRGRRQPEQQGVEIVKDRPVLVVDTP